MDDDEIVRMLGPGEQQWPSLTAKDKLFAKISYT